MAKFSEGDDKNLNAFLDALLSAYASGKITHAKAHGLLAQLVMLGVNGHADHAARFVALPVDEHFRDY